MRFAPFVTVALATAAFWMLPPRDAHAHGVGGAHSHSHHHVVLPQQQREHLVVAAAQASDAVSGQGNFRFRVVYTGRHLPAEATTVLVKAHGGFAVDRRDGHGEIYFALPGAGIIQLSPDFATAEMITTDPAMRDTNMHNATIWYGEDGTSYLTFPANDAGKVFTTTTSGELVNTLEPPQDVTFDVPAVNAYFEDGGKFVPTDVEWFGGRYYITTGYSPLDYVLTASVGTKPWSVDWQSLAFGGKGPDPGQFGTGHGITVIPGDDGLAVADRPNAEIDRFQPDGAYVDTVSLPEGSFPCDIDYTDGYSVVGCLHGPDRSKGAPIYVLKDGQVISTVMIKDELGLENFQHIHNAVMVKRDGKFYIVAQAWNPGGFAILEQVAE